MKIKITHILLLITIAIILPNSMIAQKKTYIHSEGRKYFTIELDTDRPLTWGTYRALNHHDIPYFEMTFISDQKLNEVGDTIMIMAPTFYAYSYLHDIQGVADTTNSKHQNIKFYFQVKDHGKKLEFIAPDSITREKMIAYSSFDRKLEADITSFPETLKLSKKPKWNKFPKELRKNLANRLKKLRGGASNF